MKKLLYLIGILLFLSYPSKSSNLTNNKFDKLKKTTIAGKVQNFDPEKRKIELYVNKIGLEGEAKSTKLDSLGNFSVTFETYVPTDVYLQYKINFLVLTNPGDSIHVIFDGQPSNRPDILKTIKFSGDAAKMNQDAAIFQEMYFSNEILNDFNKKQNAQKDYGLEAYEEYLETLKEEGNKLFEKFVSEVSPDNTTKTWAYIYTEQVYYENLSFYPKFHQMMNQLKPSEWNVPLSYYNPFKNRFPITKDMLISSSALSSFINQFHFSYVYERLLNSNVIEAYKKEDGSIDAPEGLLDSLHIQSILNYTDDDLAKQMVLTELFSQSLEANNIDFFENSSGVINKYITEPFLKQPLLKKYNKVKKWNINPEIASDAMLSRIEESSAQQIINRILENNKGKVVYMDCWATWCGPCRAEMPESKKLMKELDGQDVTFVFLCLDSDEKGWKAVLTKYQLGGQHYFLTQKQSSDIRKSLDIQGVPHYFLIDKKGIIREKGSHLRPNSVKDKIKKLINK